MAETSRSRVTITLGRTGQVVKRAGAAGQGGNSGFSDSHPAVGSKRSVRDRLGSNVDGIQLNNKRFTVLFMLVIPKLENAAGQVWQRGDGNKLMMNGGKTKGLDAPDRLGKNDLRLKLMRKNLSRQVESDKRNGVDLRETLSRVARPRPSAVGGSIRQHAPEPTDSRHFVPERKNVSMLGQIPSMRSSEAFLGMDSLRNSYSPWTLDSLRRRSPDRVVRTSRNLSPPRNDEQIGKRPLIRTYDDARRFSYLSRDILEPRRPMGTSPYMTRPIVSAASVKPVVPLPAPPPPPSGIAQKSSYTVQANEHLTVDGLLHSLGLDKYAIYFKAEEVDMTALKQMGDNDFKNLGIPMHRAPAMFVLEKFSEFQGPRKKIQLALLPQSKR
ncbi:hypothetical protein RHSIM_Rhsim12G0125300 [Rhododendron simsii]|uniref:SAM domain-containing protein n=1 Tax=Rhododendron simsii TaxID=118357 RepID=A0A834G6Y7_RHOSS|nr:hypothetical protein RHSIM_Rhsim12G0125300 [Rhododendron simsii]